MLQPLYHEHAYFRMAERMVHNAVLDAVAIEESRELSATR